MLLETISEVSRYIPSACRFNPDPATTDFDLLRSFVEEAELWLKTELAGEALYADLLAHGDDGSPAISVIKALVACKAYHSAIPFIDLVWTPNGFAIVSNQNQAPASRERVERLLSSLDKRISDLLDSAISLFMQSQDLLPLFRQAGKFDYLTECLFMTATDLRNFARKDAQRSDLEAGHATLMFHQSKIAEFVSPEYLEGIINRRRENALTPYDNINLLKLVLGELLLNGFSAKAEHFLGYLVNTMVADIANYPEYRDSPTYALKMAPKLEEKGDKPVFFAGVF